MAYDFSTETRPTLLIKDLVIPERLRKDYGDVMGLAASIRDKGLIQPIVVEMREGKPHLLAGGRRTQAFLVIPESGGRIPFTTRDGLNELQRLEIELEENVCRKDMSSMEQLDALEKIDSLKRRMYGESNAQNPDGWNLKKTAELAGIALGPASEQIRLARTLKERPDIKEKVKNLPVSAAMRVTAMLLETEQNQARADKGELKLDHDFKNLSAQDYLRSLPDASVDLFLTDPPFGMNILEELAADFNAPTITAGNVQSFIGQMQSADNLTREQVEALLREVLPEMFRTLKDGRHAYVFFELENLGMVKTLVEAAGFTISWPVLIWDKGRTTNPFRGYSYQSCYEAVLFLYKGKDPRRLSDASGAILRFSALHATKKIHIFEKPLDLLASLIKRSSLYGENICDPFAGSGATLLAAKQCGRRPMGCEKNPEHFMKAQVRLVSDSVSPTPEATK